MSRIAFLVNVSYVVGHYETLYEDMMKGRYTETATEYTLRVILDGRNACVFYG